MSRAIPDSIISGHTGLNPDPLITLFEILIPGQATIYLSPDKERTWLGNLYEFLPAHLADVSYESNGKLNRPKFSLANPSGIFSADVASGRMDSATVKRIRVLPDDLTDNLDFALRETFSVGRIVSLTNQMVIMELRDCMDGSQFSLPARRYMPPEFPHVRLN